MTELDTSVIEPTSKGLYVPAGDFYIDPWQPVRHAVLTHGHADHARPGSSRYLAAAEGASILARRLAGANVETLEFDERQRIGDVHVSFHPAGHCLGSAQVRVEDVATGRVAVVTGDYKLEPDPTTPQFEPVPCHVFVTESTFGLPVFHWPDVGSEVDAILAWMRANREAGRASIVFAYALGKAQRLMAEIGDRAGEVRVHGAVARLNEAYAEAGVELPPWRNAMECKGNKRFHDGWVLAPPSAAGTPWLRRFGPAETAFASGWMQVRGFRKRRNVDRGFVISDHADWPGLLSAIETSQAEQIWVMHGYNEALGRWLRQQGRAAFVLEAADVGEFF